MFTTSFPGVKRMPALIAVFQERHSNVAHRCTVRSQALKRLTATRSRRTNGCAEAGVVMDNEGTPCGPRQGLGLSARQFVCAL